MGYHYSDPTANRAMGNLNREFSQWEKKAERICDRIESGKVSPQELARLQAEFKGLYRHVLANTLQKREEKRRKAGE